MTAASQPNTASQTDADAFVETIYQRKQDNLEFFRQHFPNIYAFFKDYTLKNKKLNVLTETQTFDLWDNGASLYDDDAIAYARKEACLFNNELEPGMRTNPVNPIFYREFSAPRLFHTTARRMLENSPLKPEDYRGYKTEASLPLVVFLGSGLGLHIEELLKIRDIKHIVISEHDPDVFAASLYTANWHQILRRYVTDSDYSVKIVLCNLADSDASDSIEIMYSIIWNNLILNCPLFPTSTYYYNHRVTEFNLKITKKIAHYTPNFIRIWGHYDDEFNQLVNLFHNLNNSPYTPSGIDHRATDLPICIIGSGPSLDREIETIRELSEKAIIVSCGSALHSLGKNGIKPDFHCELESDYLTYTMGKEDYDLGYTQDVPLIAPLHINPLVPGLFSKTLFFIKDSTCHPALISGNTMVIAHGTPSCTNAGLAFAIHNRFKKIFLFGMDFGYLDPDHHHSKNSIYYTEHNYDDLHDYQQSIKDQKFATEGVDGQEVLTTPFLFLCKSHAENAIAHRNPATSVFNCSGTALIKGCHAPDNLREYIDALPKKPPQTTIHEYFFAEEASVPASPEIAFEKIESFVRQTTAQLEQICDSLRNDMESVTDCCYQIALIAEERTKEEYGSMFYLLRGTLWFSSFNLYCHCLAIDDQERGPFIDNWKKQFKGLLDKLPQHIQQLRSLPHPDQDPRVKARIIEPFEGYETAELI